MRGVRPRGGRGLWPSGARSRLLGAAQRGRGFSTKACDFKGFPSEKQLSFFEPDYRRNSYHFGHKLSEKQLSHTYSNDHVGTTRQVRTGHWPVHLWFLVLRSLKSSRPGLEGIGRWTGATPADFPQLNGHTAVTAPDRHTKKHRTSRRRTRHAHGAVGPPGDPFGPQWLSQRVSSRDVGTHRGFRQRPYRAQAVRAGGCALFLLEPAQEGRLEGFGPVQVEVGGHRVEATEQVRADGQRHGDWVWMSWHGVVLTPARWSAVTGVSPAGATQASGSLRTGALPPAHGGAAGGD